MSQHTSTNSARHLQSTSQLANIPIPQGRTVMEPLDPKERLLQLLENPENEEILKQARLRIPDFAKDNPNIRDIHSVAYLEAHNEEKETRLPSHSENTFHAKVSRNKFKRVSEITQRFICMSGDMSRVDTSRIRKLEARNRKTKDFILNFNRDGSPSTSESEEVQRRADAGQSSKRRAAINTVILSTLINQFDKTKRTHGNVPLQEVVSRLGKDVDNENQQILEAQKRLKESQTLNDGKVSGLQDYNSGGGVGDREEGEPARVMQWSEPSPVLAGGLPSACAVGGTDEGIDTCGESWNVGEWLTPSCGSANGVGATHGGGQSVSEDPDKSKYSALDLGSCIFDP